MTTIEKAFDEILNSSQSMEEKMAEFMARVQFTYTMFIEHFDDVMENDCVDENETNELLDERNKAQKVIDWVSSLSPYDNLEESIARFHAMPKPEGDPFARE